MFKKIRHNLRPALPAVMAALAAAVIVLAWTEPSQTPPSGNVNTPINIGSMGQSKMGNLALNTDNILTNALLVPYGRVGIGTLNPATKLEIFGGDLKVGGSIIDSVGNIIYNNSTKKIERARLPFEQGDITSDVDTNTWDIGYYNVSQLVPANVKSGIPFGRSQTGTMTQGYTKARYNYGGETSPTCELYTLCTAVSPVVECVDPFNNTYSNCVITYVDGTTRCAQAYFRTVEEDCTGCRMVGNPGEGGNGAPWNLVPCQIVP